MCTERKVLNIMFYSFAMPALRGRFLKIVFGMWCYMGAHILVLPFDFDGYPYNSVVHYHAAL